MKKIVSLLTLGLMLLCAACENVEIPEAPNSNLATVSNVNFESVGRALTITWDLPADTSQITGIQIIKNMEGITELEGAKSSYYLRRADTNQDILYTIKIKYGDMVSLGQTITVHVPFDNKNTKAAFLLTASSIDNLPNDEEKAAANWFNETYVAKEKGVFITPEQLQTANSDMYSVIWIHLDRIGLPVGWQNLPDAVSAAESVAGLKAYAMDGGNLFLSKQATQLLVAIERLEEKYAPNIYSSGAPVVGEDHFTMNANIGQGTYDRRKNKFFKKLKEGDPNGWGFKTYPLVSPGLRGDNNCMWDCNAFGFPGNPDVIMDFQVTLSATVLATWGHVTDFCCAGVVEFNPTEDYVGNMMANGLAAFQFNGAEGKNTHQSNVETFAKNVLDNYMK